MNVLDRAIKSVGSGAELARRLGVVPMTVTQWRRRGRVPAERCAAIEMLTDGRVTRHDLRPDVFGPLPDASGEDAQPSQEVA